MNNLSFSLYCMIFSVVFVFIFQIFHVSENEMAPEDCDIL